MSRLLPLLCFPLLALASCAKPSQAVSATAQEGTAATRMSWEQLSFEQRKARMQHEVLPQLADKFQAYDGDRFAEFNCVTCHGRGAESGSFELPSADLPTLPAAAELGGLAEAKPDLWAFMLDVEHTTAALIDTEPYDPQTGEGFGCYDCHLSQ